MRLLPALMLAYFIMVLAWPWAALAPLNPVRGLLAFSEFNYSVRTVTARSTKWRILRGFTCRST